MNPAVLMHGWRLAKRGWVKGLIALFVIIGFIMSYDSLRIIQKKMALSSRAYQEMSPILLISPHEEVEKGNSNKGEDEEQEDNSNKLEDEEVEEDIKDAPPEMLAFRDKFFAPLLEKFRKLSEQDHVDLIKPRYKSGYVPKAYMYTRGGNWLKAQINDIIKGVCPVRCEITTNREEISSSDAVIIHLRSLKTPEKMLEELGPRNLSQPWVMFEIETQLLANNLNHLKYSTLNGFFNRTMHHRTDSDIVLYHGFIVRRGKEAALLPPTWRRFPIMYKTNHTRKLVGTFLSNCNDNNNRYKYIKALQEFIPVDVYGKCGQFKCGGSSYAEHFYRPDTDECIKQCGENYLFLIAFENARCTDYISERMYNVIYYRVVPIVMGGVNYTDVMPPHSFINAGDYAPKELAEKLQYLAANPQEYEKYLEWRHYFQPSTTGGARVFCNLCFELNNPKFYEYNVYEDFHDWFVTKSDCNRSGTVVRYYRKQDRK